MDRSRLPIGDGKVTTSKPQAGYVYRCGVGGRGGGAFKDGPWIKSDGTFDITAKATVDGSVTWPYSFSITTQGGKRVIASNDLPNHPTGTYPVATNDDAYQYDRNPNRISAQTIRIELPLSPTIASAPACLTAGAIGVLLTGTVFFDGLDALNRDAVAHEIQDACQGHPEVSGTYHYHNLTLCMQDNGGGHSPLMGYAFDGFGIYGHYGEGGVELTNEDLDECHGHKHVIQWEGKQVSMYHYHATHEYPYTLGCFRGTAVRLPGGQQQPPPGGGPPR